MRTLLTNVKRLVDNEIFSCEILIENGDIVQIGEKLTVEAEEIVDGLGNLAVPGFVDVHVHLREPGGEAKETIKTGTLAAARGGFTTICAMPNTRPVPDSEETLAKINDKIDSSAHVRVLPYASITVRQLGRELTDMAKLKKTGAFAFTDDGVGVQTADMMLKAMEKAAAIDAAIVAHCEDNSLIHQGVVHEGKVSERFNVPGIPSVCEAVQIARDVLLAEKTGCHYHVCHVSSKESVRVIRDAKKAGIKVTAEVTPHHLLLNEEDITADTGMFKMNPPLRSKEDQQALLEGLLDGTIDFIATDHAPHTEEEKNQGLIGSPFGIVGLETAFPLLYTELVLKEKITLDQLIDWLTVKPAQTFQLPYGQLKQGSIADIALLDLTKTAAINKETFYSKGKNTPFHGWKVTGDTVMTIAGGQIVYQEAAYEKTSTNS